MARILIAAASCALLAASLWARQRLFTVERHKQRRRQLAVAWISSTAAAAGGLFAALAGESELSMAIFVGAAASLAISPPKILPDSHN